MKTILITGGAKRLGRALVEHYAASGWRVLFTVNNSFSEGSSLAARLGPNVHCIQSLVSTQENAQSVAGWVKTFTAELDLLVCSASTFKKLELNATTQQDFTGLLESNLIGPYFLIQQCVPMLAAAKGCVVNIADAQAQNGVAHFSAYVAAKAGLISITKSLSIELAPTVRVNAILPGSLPWPESEEEYSEADRRAMTSAIPMQRIGSWADVVGAVDYLAQAPFVNGACVPVDGGRASVF